MADVLVSGLVVLDFVFAVDAFPREPEKHRAKRADIVGGGNGGNASVAIARLGGAVRLVARLGDDPIADLITGPLEEEGVDCTLVRRFPDIRSSFSSIYVDAKGERQIVNFRDFDLPADAGWLAEGAGEFKGVLADSRWPEGAFAAMQVGRARGVPAIMDVEAPTQGLSDALNTATHCAFSAQGAADWTGFDDVEKAARAADADLPGTIIVTDGENGVVVMRDGEPVWFPAYPINPVDTLGAGDIWHGAFALQLARGVGEDDAIRFASAAAALKCTRFGGRDGAPTRAETLTFMEQHA